MREEYLTHSLNVKSRVGDSDSRPDTPESRVESLESKSCNPFTEDQCTEDSFSEDLFTSKDASHPAHSGGIQEEGNVEVPSPLFSFKRRGFLSGSLASWWRRNALETQSAAYREDVHV
jgi:hypothetical protein